MANQKKSRWICIRECYDGTRVWYVGEKTLAPEAPMPKHFERVFANQNPIDMLRMKFDEHGVEYDESWDIKRLAQELDNIRDWEAKVAAQEKKKAALELKKEPNSKKGDEE